MTPEAIAAVVGVVISLGLEYFPKVSDWYSALSEGYKKLYALGIGLVVAAVAFGLGCANLVVPYWSCDGAGAWDAFLVWGAYVLANQTTFALVVNKFPPKPK
ncbi:MAG: hypothetical protein ACW97P_04645 [Candidatus Hodarchaeales archaeon]|jgi:hypothetical protein